MTDNEQLVRDFINAWPRLDPDELVGFFHPEGTYHNMPLAPAVGRDGIRAMISGFISSWRATEWEVLNLISAGPIVVAERVDRMDTEQGPVALPVVGVFELEGGQIKAWRDYFDLASYTNQLA